MHTPIQGHADLVEKYRRKLKPGTVSDSPVITMDLFPTLLEMVGLSAPDSQSKTGAAGQTA